MATIVTRVSGASPKGSPLSNEEIDANFINLNSELILKLIASNNLSDLADLVQARTNLQVDSSSKTTAKAVAMAIALG